MSDDHTAASVGSPASGTDVPEPPGLRRLRLMVTGLTGLLMLAVIVVIVVLVIRLSQAPRSVVLQMPDNITLPDGMTAQSATFGRSWILVVGRDRDETESILIFDRQSGEIRRTIRLDP